MSRSGLRQDDSGKFSESIGGNGLVKMQHAKYR